MNIARQKAGVWSSIGIAVAIVTLFLSVIVNAYTQPWLPLNLTAISTGGSTSCAIANGAAYCWGDNSTGGLGNNSTTDSLIPVPVDTSGVLNGKTVTAISVGSSSACAVASGAAYCWGYDGNGRLGNNSTTQSLVPVAVTTSGVLNGKTVTAISAGGSFTCAVASGKAYCWGYNSNGQLGNNSTTGSVVPVAVDTSGVLASKTVTAISVGTPFTCAVASGAAYCWGINTNGRLGNNSTTQSTVPVAVDTSGVLASKTVTAISAGSTFTCAVASSAAYCWGANGSGRLGNNSTVTSLVPVAVDTSGVLSGTTVTAINSGTSSSCVIASSASYCWGDNTYGQLGNNSTTQSKVPVAVDTSGVLNGTTVTATTVGGTTACVIASGAAYCWGANTTGQLGNNSTTQSLVPVSVSTIVTSTSNNYRFYNTSGTIAPGSPLGTMNQAVTVPAGMDNIFSFTTMNAGNTSTCATASGAAYCWGDNSTGQLGNNSTTASLVPVAVDTSGVLAGKTVTAISTGSTSACAIASSAAYCWGSNGNGRLGNNSTTQSNAPVAVNTSGVLAGKTVTAISTGSYSTCAVASGAAYCWGDNTYGQLGNNSTTQSNVPVAVDTSGVLAGKTVTAISTGSYSTCAVASGAVYCWGYNYYGQLGNNSTTQSNVPVAVDTSGVLAGKTVTAISASSYSNCVIASGAAYCWGTNGNGRLGNNSTTQSNVPVAVDTSGVLAGKTVTAISAGGYSTCAIASSAAYCWGSNGNGRLGNNSTTQSNVPVAVDTSGVLAGKTVTAISAGSFSACAVASSAAYCWGYNFYGQLGDNSTTERHVPVDVSVPTGTGDSPGQSNGFRLSIGVGQGVPVTANQVSYQLQYAKKTASTCSTQTTGFTAVTTSTPIAWYDPGAPTNGATLTSNGSDPTFSGTTVYETYVSGGTSFTNPTAIPSGQYGLWSFSLKNISTAPTDVYCMSLAYADGTPVDTYAQYPEIGTTPPPPTIGFVDNSGSPVTSPIFTMSATNVMTSCQTSTGTMGSSGGQKMRIAQAGSPANGWNVAIAPTSGDTATWYDSTHGSYYDFNDSAGSPAGCYPGSDGDTYAGQLSVNNATSAVAPQSGCSTTGISLASGSTPFVNGTTSAITLITSSSASQSSCYWDLYGTQFSQKIPPSQPAGSYVFNLTATVTAS